MRSALVGIGPLIRLVLRRDRVRLAVWLVVLTAVPAATPRAFTELFPTDAARAAYAAGVASNPALMSIQGPIFGSSLGALTAARTMTIASTLVALLSVLTVIRHTRPRRRRAAGSCSGPPWWGARQGWAPPWWSPSASTWRWPPP